MYSGSRIFFCVYLRIILIQKGNLIPVSNSLQNKRNLASAPHVVGENYAHHL